MKRRTFPLRSGKRAVTPFVLLSLEHQRASVLKLADSGASDHAIAQICGLDVALVRSWIAQRGVARTKEAGRT